MVFSFPPSILRPDIPPYLRKSSMRTSQDKWSSFLSHFEFGIVESIVLSFSVLSFKISVSHKTIHSDYCWVITIGSPLRSFNLSLNYSPLSTSYEKKALCDFSQIIFECSKLMNIRISLFIYLLLFGIPSPSLF